MPLRTAFLLWAVAVALLCLFPARTAFAQCGDGWRTEQGLAPNGPILQGVWFDDGNGPAYFAIGRFKSAGGEASRDIARWGGASWNDMGIDFWSLQSPIPTTTACTSMVVHQGELIVAGVGDNFGFVHAWNGQNWRPLGSKFPALGLTVSTHDGDLYICGQASNNVIGYLRKWNGLAWIDIPGFQGYANILQPNPLFSFEGELLCGGGSSPTAFFRDLMAWNGSSWRQFGSRIFGSPLSYAVHNGQLVVGGQFRFTSNGPAHQALRWTGTEWLAMSAGLPVGTRILTLTMHDGDLWCGLQLPVSDNPPSEQLRDWNIARWNGESWEPMGARHLWTVNSLASHEGALWASGANIPAPLSSSFAEFANLSYWPVVYNSGDRWRTVSSAFREPLYAALVFEGDIVFGGDFTTDGISDLHHIARRTPDGVFHPMGSGFNGPVYCLAMHNGELYAGGAFTASGETSLNRIARWNGTQWLPVGVGFANGAVEELLSHSSGLVAGGTFTASGTTVTKLVARWNGSSWMPMGAGLEGGNNAVFRLAHWNNYIVAGGSFVGSGTVPTSNIALWNGTAWVTQPIISGRSSNAHVYAIAVYNNALYVAGTGSSLQYWTGSQWQSRSFGNATGNVYRLSPSNDKLYIGGDFTSSADVKGAAQIWPSSGPHSLPPDGVSSRVDVIIPVEDGILFAGAVHTLNPGIASPGWAVWTGNPGPVITRQPNSRSVLPGTGHTAIDVRVAGAYPRSFQWYKDGQPLCEGECGTGTVYLDTQTNRLRLLNVNAGHNGIYHCVITDDCDTVVTEPATVFVCAADWNEDFSIDDIDIWLFFIRFEQGVADVNQDGSVDDLDITAFFQAFEAGC